MIIEIIAIKTKVCEGEKKSIQHTVQGGNSDNKREKKLVNWLIRS